MTRATRFLSAVVAPLFGTVVLLQAGAYAQPIVIPDFREKPTVAEGVPDGPCDECGVIRSIREVHRRRDAPAYKTGGPDSPGAFDNRAVGALVVLPFGPGTAGNTSPVGGAGTPEMRDRFSEVSYDVTLRMDDGGLRTIERRDGAQYRIGDRVRIAQGRMELLPSSR